MAAIEDLPGLCQVSRSLLPVTVTLYQHREPLPLSRESHLCCCCFRTLLEKKNQFVIPFHDFKEMDGLWKKWSPKASTKSTQSWPRLMQNWRELATSWRFLAWGQALGFTLLLPASFAKASLQPGKVCWPTVILSCGYLGNMLSLYTWQTKQSPREGEDGFHDKHCLQLSKLFPSLINTVQGEAKPSA